MSSTYAKVCETCGTIAPGPTDGWLHLDIRLNMLGQPAATLDVCAHCCKTKTIGELKAALDAQPDMTLVRG